MEKEILENLQGEISKYVLTSKLLNAIIDELITLIKENSNLILCANKEDIKISKKQINIEDFIEIVNKYKNTEKILQEDKRKIIVYKGDPYLTLHLCMQALLLRNKILLVRDEFMLGVNDVILEIVIKVFEKYKITNLILSTNNYSIKEIEQVEKYSDKIIVIGDTTMCQILEEKFKIKYFPYNNIMLYCNDDKLLKLQEAIYVFANESNYEIEILYEENLEEVIQIINSDNMANIAILLTNNEENRKIFKKQIKNKKVFVNENPFKNTLTKVYNYLK